MNRETRVNTADAATLPAPQLLAWAADQFPGRFAIVTSFQREGMVLIHMALAEARIPVRVLTIDTGRLPQATLDMIEAVEQRYQVAVERLHPDAGEVGRMVARHGRDLFLQGAPYRQLCCQIRKVLPMERALHNLDAWAVGLRRSQSDSRAAVERLQPVGGRWKLSPLADWTADDIAAYIRRHNVPEHPLYGLGYASIGCDPCTRAIQPGEDERAGRWWWEDAESAKECGLHFLPDGTVRRTVDVLLSEVLETTGHA